MESLQTKMQVMEAPITDMAGKIDAYFTKMDRMMGTIKDNDKSMKGTVEDMRGTIENKMGEL